MRKFHMMLMLAMMLMLLLPAHSEALSCAPPKPVNEEMERSGVVFKGNVLAAKDNGLTVFQVEQAWKGIDRAIVAVYSNGWDSYSEGADYLVFASENSGKIVTNLCGNSGIWHADLAERMNDVDIHPAEYDVSAADRLLHLFLTNKGLFIIVFCLFFIILISMIVLVRQIRIRRN